MLEQKLAQITQEYPEKIALICDRSKITYEELYTQVKGFSRGLSSLGIRPSDCIAVVLPNCPEFVVSFYAAAKLNAIFLPLNHLFKEEELSYYINDSNAQVIITDTTRADLCHQIISKSGREIELITVEAAYPSATYFDDLILSEAAAEPEDNQFLAGEKFLYQYSSGSTGRPKRVGRTQDNLYHEVNNFTQTAKVTSADNILCLVPMYHAHGLGNCLLASIYNGATLVILEQFRQQETPVEVPFIFRRLRVLELIEQEQITILPAVPYIFDTLAQTPADVQADLTSLRLCFSAGNFLSQDIFESFRARFGISIKQLYGCTEAGSVAINLDEQTDQPYGSVGRPIQNVEITIIDDQGTQLPVGEIGEIVIKSKTLTTGYDNMPELNQQAFKDEAFFTGDLGKIEHSGRLYITGRKKILIDTGGRKVDPIEIEDVLITHLKIKEAVVVGAKGLFGGEIIKAVIVPQESQTCEAKEIVAYCQARLAEFKVPKIIEFRTEIPKSPLGKILRKALV